MSNSCVNHCHLEPYKRLMFLIKKTLEFAIKVVTLRSCVITIFVNFSFINFYFQVFHILCLYVKLEEVFESQNFIQLSDVISTCS